MKKIYFFAFVLCNLQIVAQHNNISSARESIWIDSFSKQELMQSCLFHAGDTLIDFDFNSALAEARSENIKLYAELKSFMRIRQTAFVNKKYKIIPIPSSNNIQSRFNVPPSPTASACNNLDFENLSFSGWVGSSGFNQNSAYTPTLTLTGSATYGTNMDIYDCNDGNIITSAYGNDPIGSFPGLRPGSGTCSARLGGFDLNTTSGAGFNCDSKKAGNPYSNGEKLSQTFTVTSSNALVSFSYAIILNTGGHAPGNQPYFQVSLKYASGSLISCSQYYVQAPPSGSLPGFQISSTANPNDGTTMYYSNWRTANIDLSPYMGQVLTLSFEVAGCTYGSHPAWAYVDATCGPASITAIPATPGCSPGTDTLIAPLDPGGIYNWSGPGIVGATNTQSVVVNASGTYTVTIGNSSCATLTKNVSFAATPTLSCTGGGGAICPGQSTTLVASGATSYTWMPGGAHTSTLSVSTPGVYTVTGSNGSCSSSPVTVPVTGYPPTTLSLTATEASCAPPCFSFSTTPPGFSYQWDFGNGNTSSLQNPSNCYATPGTYTVKLIEMDYNGCYDTAFVTVTDTCKLVWPGDADDNLIVANTDLLPIGVEYGKNGPARSTVSNVWQEYLCSDWADTLSNGKNIKYADCNGDGTINMNDTLAVNLNYGQTHTIRLGHQIIQTTNPDVYLQFNKAQYLPGDTVFADVLIGSNASPQANFYGAAFNLNYDNSKVQSGTEKFWFNNSWVGNINLSKIKFSKINPGVGVVDVSLVRITHTDTNGFGKIATLQFILKTGLPAGEMYFTITNAIKTNSAGNITNLNTGTDSLEIINATTAVQQSSGKQFSIFPNPATNKIIIQSFRVLGSIVIYNSLGEIALQTISKNAQEQIDINKLPAGMYFVEVKNNRIKLIKN